MNLSEEQSRLIEVAWDISLDSVYKVNIFITANDRANLVGDILTITSESKLNIFSMNCKADKNKLATMEFGIDITSLEQLEYIMNRIRRLKGVYSVERIVSGHGGLK